MVIANIPKWSKMRHGAVIGQFLLSDVLKSTGQPSLILLKNSVFYLSMNTKAKGTNAERELIHMFWSNGYGALRAAGSGSNSYPCPDLIVGNNVRKLAIEVKNPGKDYQHLEKKQIEDLQTFSTIFGAEPWIAVKFKQWHFLTLEDLNQTNTNYSITQEIAERKGLSFEELIHL